MAKQTICKRQALNISVMYTWESCPSAKQRCFGIDSVGFATCRPFPYSVWVRECALTMAALATNVAFQKCQFLGFVYQWKYEHVHVQTNAKFKTDYTNSGRWTRAANLPGPGCSKGGYRGTQRQFSENICSEENLRSRIFGTFVVNSLPACLS